MTSCFGERERWECAQAFGFISLLGCLLVLLLMFFWGKIRSPDPKKLEQCKLKIVHDAAGLMCLFCGRSVGVAYGVDFRYGVLESFGLW